MGLAWSGCKTLVPGKTWEAPLGSGLYVLADNSPQENICIGQSGKCADRLLSHSRKSLDGKKLDFSFHGVEKTILPYQLKELENDLIRNFFENFRKAPEFQYRNST